MSFAPSRVHVAPSFRVGLAVGRWEMCDQIVEERRTWNIASNDIYQVRYDSEWVYDVADRFTDSAMAHGSDPVALAVTWVGSQPAVTAPIVAARNVDQLEGSLGAAQIQMTPALRDEVLSLSPTPPPATDRNHKRTPVNYGVR